MARELAANDEQIRLYHDIGREILERQGRQGWGAKVIVFPPIFARPSPT